MSDWILRDLHGRLVEDKWRREAGFSEDIEQANRVLFHPFASNADRERVLNLWLQRNQPCLFGRIAAAQRTIHYCVITADDLQRSDDEIGDQIHQELRSWKRRSIRPAPEVSLPAHGFMLVVASPRVCLAEPNETLRRFADRLLEIWECSRSVEQHGPVHWESIYLEDPRSNDLLRFSISIDFFASQGDGRWWHDHGVPGGLAFTANSAGHMGRYREWYEGKTGQRVWLLATAMSTIHAAAATSSGRATWLREVPKDGRPLLPNLPSPFNGEDMKPELRGKDWTRYAGRYHTDQAVRPEFFSDASEKPLGVQSTEWLLDFAYLYDNRLHDHRRFVTGEAVSLEEVTADIGAVEEWVKIVSPRRRTRIKSNGAPSDREEVQRLVEGCEQWAMSPEELTASS